MKKISLLWVLLIAASAVQAQTLNEWFNQKKTQIRYLVEQIAALKAYGEVVNKGYDIARYGITNIFESKEGDFKQHDSYFLSLLKVKSGISSYPKVQLILQMKREMERQCNAYKSLPSDYLSQKEIEYIKSVSQNLVDGGNKSLDELLVVTSDDKLSLTDDKRIKRIDQIHSVMQDRYSFSKAFARTVKLSVVGRFKEKGEIQKLKSLHDLQ